MSDLNEQLWSKDEQLRDREARAAAADQRAQDADAAAREARNALTDREKRGEAPGRAQEVEALSGQLRFKDDQISRLVRNPKPQVDALPGQLRFKDDQISRLVRRGPGPQSPGLGSPAGAVRGRVPGGE